MDPISSLALLSGAFLVAKLLHLGLGRWGIPGIILELFVGFVVGNWIAAPAQVGPILGAAELGVLSLFFLVGLETDFSAIRRFLRPILQVAAISVLGSAGIFLLLQKGFGLRAGESWIVAATLMTSGTGMVMRVLQDQNALSSPSGRVLLGASILGDFPAIVLLAWALGRGTAKGGMDWSAWISGILVAVCVLTAVLWFGAKKPKVATPILLPILVLGAWASFRLGATSLVGAILVGMAFRTQRLSKPKMIIQPYAQFLIPLYFITVGMRLSATALGVFSSWILGFGLFVIAFIGRLPSAQGCAHRENGLRIDPWLVMWGMIPRGLPGLVFATMARQGGALSATTYFGLVMMVTLTNLVGLAGLSWRLRKAPKELFSGS